MSGMGVGDDSVRCFCGKETSAAMIVKHLEEEHGIDPEEIANAPVVDASAQGDDFRALRNVMSIGGQPGQKEIEEIVAVFERTRVELALLGYPSFLHVFAPGEYGYQGAMPESHIFTLVGPVAGPVDLWRQAARRSRT